MPASPAGQRPALSTTEPAGSRENRNRESLHPRTVAREFARLLKAHDIDTHPAEVRQLGARFGATEHARIEDVEAYFLNYVDPTGETAVRNVRRGAS